MNKLPREPQLDEKVKIKDNEKTFKVESVFLTTVNIVESRKGRGEREKFTVNVDELTYCEPEKFKTKRKQYKDAPPIKVTREQRMQILKNLVVEKNIQLNFKWEIIQLARLIRKFPHVEFLLEGFKPAIKASSVLYWIDRPEVEELYKNWAIDLTKTTERVILEKEKVVEDIVFQKKNSNNILDILD